MISESPSAKPQLMQLGVCYYPEHWPESQWANDARRMREIGLTRVRIGEFAWSRIEPEPGRFDWAWLDRAIETLHAAGLGVILGTPTATPPKWLVDTMPGMIAIDRDGRPRRFGSRRHYCFSHIGYRKQAARITRAMAERYGHHPAIVAWQTDNEYGCHDTVQSFSPAALAAFRVWLAEHYGDVAALNQAWGNVFWSQEYRSFDEIDLPNLTVTEANPAHRLAFRRFASDEVVRFNQIQVDILRALSPGRDITDRYPNPLIETVLARFMAEGRYAAHLRRARKRCRMARDALVEGLSGAPLYLTIPDQGLHLVAHARNDLSDADLQRLAQTGGLASRRLSDMFIQAPAQQGLVIGYSGFEADEVRTAALGAARSISCWRKRR